MIKDFSSWEEYEGASEGSGRSEKIWLVNPINGDIGLFKFNKSEFTTEHLSEKIASELAQKIGLGCSIVDLGIYNSKIGSLNYKINKEDEILVEGIQLITRYYPDYDPDSLYDKVNDEYYSLEMILKSLQEYSFQKEFLKIPIFDFLIGNTDRHQNNWAIIQAISNSRLSPIYDNGSSLCSYVDELQIDNYLGNDKVRFRSLVNSKSTSRIRLDKKTKKEPRQLEVLEYLRDNYYEDVLAFIKEIIYNINESIVNSLLEEYTEEIVSKKRKLLIKKFLLEKVKLISELFNLRKEETRCQEEGIETIFI